MPGVVKDSAGQPLTGVQVFADNTLYSTTNALGKTDAWGCHRITRPREVGTWRAGASVQRTSGGEAWEPWLHADNGAAFPGDQGAVRHFIWRRTGQSQ
ncbi:hypothetical protein F8S09_06850 [Deinococcus sp. SDU3-2]|uniref:Carboxypeptidase regulatory-like domain-containing protein n=1 Tax=Deinococcus terrestris TaxID=2651870 RepID=A0A7X1TRH1_9DEIO|nr:hypothetical protein [Deinococcus terrestris]MPY66414.1 hypothetical protein [Deinococcus terrestris]